MPKNNRVLTIYTPPEIREALDELIARRTEQGTMPTDPRGYFAPGKLIGELILAELRRENALIEVSGYFIADPETQQQIRDRFTLPDIAPSGVRWEADDSEVGQEAIGWSAEIKSYLGRVADVENAVSTICDDLNVSAFIEFTNVPEDFNLKNPVWYGKAARELEIDWWVTHLLKNRPPFEIRGEVLRQVQNTLIADPDAPYPDIDPWDELGVIRPKKEIR